MGSHGHNCLIWILNRFQLNLRSHLRKNVNIFMLGIVKTKQLILGFGIGLWVTKGHFLIGLTTMLTILEL